MAKINSIDRALDILILMYKKNKALGVSEIGRALDLHKSTVYRTLETLEARGFVSRSNQDKYWLGVKLYALGAVAGNTIPVRNLIQPYAKALSQKFNEVVNVSILDETVTDIPTTILIVKEIAVQNSLITVNPPLGASSEAHYSAVGKCLLAFTSEEVIDSYTCSQLPVYTKNTISDWNQLLEELKVVKAQGYAMDNEDYEVGLTCIATPILDGNGHAIAALSLSGPSERMRKHDFKILIEELKATTAKISRILDR